MILIIILSIIIIQILLFFGYFAYSFNVSKIKISSKIRTHTSNDILYFVYTSENKKYYVDEILWNKLVIGDEYIAELYGINIPELNMYIKLHQIREV